MDGEKEYTYKIERDDSIRDVRRVYTDSNRRITEVIRNGRNGIFKPTLNLRAKTIDIAAGKKTCSEYGEFIGHKMLQKMGIESCDVEMVKRFIKNPRSKSGKGNEVPGAISYIHLDEGEDLISAMSIISRYKYDHEDEYKKIVNPLGMYDNDQHRIHPENEEQNNNIEVIIPAFMQYVRDNGGTEEEAEAIKQRIIEMVVFDCRMANRDRHDENYGLARRDGGVRFYPLYDNEYVLGFSEPIADIEKYSAARLQEHITRDLYSVMGVTSQPTKLAASSMMSYLFSAYPEETQKAYEKVMEFTTQDLLELMEECEGLPEENKAYAARIFRLRGREMEAVQQEYIDENGKPIKQILPGNKPMELVKGSTGSSGSNRQANGTQSQRVEEKIESRTETRTKDDEVRGIE